MKYNSIHFPKIDSTNLYIKNNYEKLDDFTFVSSDYQTNGKGRNDRIWSSKENENLMFSLLIKNKEIIDNYLFLSLVTAVSVTELIEHYVSIKVEIKWPNDIYINDKKVCGILLEGRLPEYLVIGIGINVNQKEFVGEYRKEPTSLYLEIGHTIDLNLLKEEIYEKLYDNIHNFLNRKEFFINFFNERNYLENKEVNYIYNNNPSSGIVLGVDESFNIIIKNEQGEHHISSGEIDLLK